MSGGCLSFIRANNSRGSVWDERPLQKEVQEEVGKCFSFKVQMNCKNLAMDKNKSLQVDKLLNITKS
jgi:hypothetical protein